MIIDLTPGDDKETRSTGWLRDPSSSKQLQTSEISKNMSSKKKKKKKEKRKAHEMSYNTPIGLVFREDRHWNRS